MVYFYGLWFIFMVYGFWLRQQSNVERKENDWVLRRIYSLSQLRLLERGCCDANLAESGCLNDIIVVNE